MTLPPPKRDAAATTTFLTLPRELRRKILVDSNAHLQLPDLTDNAELSQNFSLKTYSSQTRDWASTLREIVQTVDDVDYVDKLWLEEVMSLFQSGTYPRDGFFGARPNAWRSCRDSCLVVKSKIVWLLRRTPLVV